MHVTDRENSVTLFRIDFDWLWGNEVYHAKDMKLGREVAIKVLPEEFARDADYVDRFQREAKLLASLNHPNIAAIYGPGGIRWNIHK
jgi:serine/threonine protein kinase